MKKKVCTVILMVAALMLWTPAAWSADEGSPGAANVEEVQQSAETAFDEVMDAEVVAEAGEAGEEAAAEAREVPSDAEEAFDEVMEEARDTAAADPLDTAEALIKKGGLENRKKALDISLEVVKTNPESYRANWMAARACREYANTVKREERPGWEDVCREYGKKGMNFAEKATQLNPDGVEGYYWYGTNVGIYSDGTGILTALREGLKDKTQNNFEKAYNIDKMYQKGGPIIALGRFWYVLPWPMNDKSKSMEYFREFQGTEFYGDPDTVEFNVYFAELLMDSRRTRDEARELLLQVPKLSDDPYWNKKANELLAKL
jgi:hypothetical protein